MCSVVGYIGKQFSRAYVMESLERLEYRGYDSAGFACLDASTKQIKFAKVVGGVVPLLAALKNEPIDGFIGMGHTRWSTHGIASVDNAHPHIDCKQSIALMHNGIIENHQVLKDLLLAQNHIFRSQTDSEVIVHLLEQCLDQTSTLKDALLALVSTLEGAYAVVAFTQRFNDCLIAVRKRSPLCIGIGENQMFIASDPLAFAGHTETVLFLPDMSFAFVYKDHIELFDFAGQPLLTNTKQINLNWQADGKQGYEHFMLKEIYEQKQVLYETVRAYKALDSDTIWDQMGLTSQDITELKTVWLIGCGTSYHAGCIAQFFFELIAQVRASVHIASEFRYMPFFKQDQTLSIGISQSGETADTLESLRFLQQQHISTLALTNTAVSTMVRECNGFLLTYAGKEIAVASTKAFTAQLGALYILAHRIALQKQIITQTTYTKSLEDLLIAAEVLEHVIEKYKHDIETVLAPYYARYDKAIFIGRSISYPLAREAALKLKEISYIFTDCYQAGELKHGSIALIDEHVPVYLFSTLDPIIYQKLVSNAQEIKARSGHLVVFAFEGQMELIALANYAFVIPKVAALLEPLAMIGLIQFFVYHIAKLLNKPIDKPRNLAKSVTVE